MAVHTEDSLRSSSVSKVFDLALTISAAKTGSAKCLIPRKDSQVLNLVTASAAAVCTVVADERSIAEQEEVRIGVEECPASIASEAVKMPSVASC